ncbi:protein kinase, partial [bacterium]|nr:protein kinase [bacterium]
MNKEKIDLKLLPTGLSDFDNTILEGGFPRYSLNIICGPPGSGKTIFTYQMLFANVSTKNKAVCFTTISEPPIKV